MPKQIKIDGTIENWESGKLGRNEQHAVAVDINDEINKALKLKMISIRLQESLIDELKLFAKMNDVGYQALTRLILQRWVDGEKKQLLREQATMHNKDKNNDTKQIVS